MKSKKQDHSSSSRVHLAGIVYVPPHQGFKNRLLILLLIPVLLVIIGTLGYWLIEEEYDLFEALYMTMITLSTIGYEEVEKLTWKGQLFTMFLILGGVFTFFYAFGEILRLIVSGELREAYGKRQMEQTLGHLKDHCIVCGLGRMGLLVCQEFSSQGMPFVVIDNDEELLEDFDMPHGIALHGDATSDDVLRHAGIDRAKSLITVMSSDAENLYTTMSARLLNKQLFIVARVEDQRSEIKLRRAGANRVVSPYIIGGHRLAQAVLRPTVVDFIELASKHEHVELQLEEMQIAGNSPLAGCNLRDSKIRQDMKIIIVAVKKKSGHMVFNPDPDSQLEVGDILIAIGPRESLDRLMRQAASDSVDVKPFESRE